MDQSIRDLFPMVRSKTYLNSAAMAPMPTPTVTAVTAQLNDVAENGAANFEQWAETKCRVRRMIGGMLGVAPESIAFTRNTSDGLCAVAAGLDWRAGNNIVSFVNEFPANYYPWRMVSEERGVELRLCPERDCRNRYRRALRSDRRSNSPRFC
jgi:selenocysteine lyase/cysteine desulfurase